MTFLRLSYENTNQKQTVMMWIQSKIQNTHGLWTIPATAAKITPRKMLLAKGPNVTQIIILPPTCNFAQGTDS